MAEKRLTQKQLAKRLKCDQSKVSKMINHIENARYGDIERMARELHIKINYTRG